MNWKVFWSALGIGALFFSLASVLAMVGLAVEHWTGSAPLGVAAVFGLLFGGAAVAAGVFWDRL